MTVISAPPSPSRRTAVSRSGPEPAGPRPAPTCRLSARYAVAGAVPLAVHPRSDRARVVAVVGEPERRSVDDAIHVALAESLGAAVVALDGPPCRNARAPGAPVRLLAADDADR